MSQVLVLRPEPGASQTLQRACDAGLDAIAIPLFKIEPIAWHVPDAGQFDGLLLTSANAIRFGGKQIEACRALPVHAVGQATAGAAQQAGFEVASIGDDGVDRLLQSISADQQLLHLCGEHLRVPANGRQAIRTVPVYRSREINNPDVSAAAGNVVLLHSPRAARRFATLADDQGVDRKTIALAAISQAALDGAGGGWDRAEVASRVDDPALLALAARLCNNSAPR